jgi:D-sedoheptulose 7-phosphate isomerase
MSAIKTAIIKELNEAKAALEALLSNDQTLAGLEAAVHSLVDALRAGGTIFSCGNGGSMCDAMHFAEELTGRYRENRNALRAVSISDPSHLSCVANDFGYEQVFARYLEAHGRRGDVLVAFSSSGTSPNVLRAAERARALGMSVIALTGRIASPLGALADIDLNTPAGAYADRTQELHIKMVHILIQQIEVALK